MRAPCRHDQDAVLLVVGARRAGVQAVLLDPFGDWGDDLDCPRSADVPALARALLDGGASW